MKGGLRKRHAVTTCWLCCKTSGEMLKCSQVVPGFVQNGGLPNVRSQPLWHSRSECIWAHQRLSLAGVGCVSSSASFGEGMMAPQHCFAQSTHLRPQVGAPPGAWLAQDRPLRWTRCPARHCPPLPTNRRPISRPAMCPARSSLAIGLPCSSTKQVSECSSHELRYACKMCK